MREKMNRFIRFMGPFIDGWGVAAYLTGEGKRVKLVVEHIPDMKIDKVVAEFPNMEAAEEWFERQGTDSANWVYRVINLPDGGPEDVT